MRYTVTRDHVSEYPRPITFEVGTLLVVHERYDGDEDWEDWYFCETEGQEGGWVPVQVLDFLDGKTACAKESYTARELDSRVGQVLQGSRVLNGWVWCERPDDGCSGWVPLSNLQPCP